MKTQIFINGFQRGSKENPNLNVSSLGVADTSIGTLVGIDTYTKKGVAILAKKSTTITGFTAEPHFFEITQGGITIWVQCGDGNVLYSTDGGNSWTSTNDVNMPIGSGHGNGLIYFQNYIFAFTDTNIFYHAADPAVIGWTNWTTAKSLGALQSFNTNPITGLHFPFLYPNNRGVYFGNGGNGGIMAATPQTCSIGFFGQVSNTLFNPGGTINTDFYWNNGVLLLPAYTYNVGSMDFLPPSSLAISVANYQNPAQGSDLITWDTVSNNKFSPPLRIFSNSLANGTTTAGIKQLYNRSQVLYSISGGNHAIYETNGSSFNLVEDIGLYSNVRSAGGVEIDYPVYFNSYPQAICVVGNKLLTGVATSVNTTDNTNYPPANFGIFPIGVWSIAFAKDGSHSTQCEFSLPLGNSLVSPVHDNSNSTYAKITCIRAIPQTLPAGTTGQIAIGFAYSSGSLPNTFGVALVDMFNYIDNINYTAIESELFEIGTTLNPQVVNNIEINLVKNLLTGQTIDISFRTGQDQAWSVIDTYTGDGSSNHYALTKNPIGATQFIQLRVRMATGAGGQNAAFSPQLKTVVLS